MPKYWGKQIFPIPPSGSKAKDGEKEKKKREKKKTERWRTQAAWANKFLASGVSPKWVKSKRHKRRILQGLRVAQAVVKSCREKRLKICMLHVPFAHFSCSSFFLSFFLLLLLLLTHLGETPEAEILFPPILLHN